MENGACGHRVLLVTGPSGAGRTTVMKALEDIGHEPIDNLPLSLIPRLFDGPALDRPTALGVDTRNREFSATGLVELIDALTSRPSLRFEVLYVDCAPDVLVQRFSETRRRHPLAQADSPEEGIARERDLLVDAHARADLVLDTTGMTPHETRAEIVRLFGGSGEPRLSVSVQSFSYKRGVPRGLDMVFDCRFLRNPHWQADLRQLDGRDPRVAEHVIGDPRFARFHEQLRELILLLLPAFVEEGKTHLSIGFGCTGGQHRSVTVAEKLARELAQDGWQVSKRHREMERRGKHKPGAGLGEGA